MGRAYFFMDYQKKYSLKDFKGERWKPINGYEGRYDISNKGRVKSYFGGTPNIRKSHINTSGYYHVRLMLNGVGKSISIHILVAAAFIPNPLNLPEVNHLKGKLDNRDTSIEWSTSSDNQKHAYKNGLRVPLGGTKNPKCILTEKQVLDIFNSKTTQKAAGAKHGVSWYTVFHIRRGSTWSYLTGKKYIPKNASSRNSSLQK